MLIPTFIKIPARTTKGIFEAIGAKNTIIIIKNNEWITPDNLVLPPLFIFTTVLIVAPQETTPPNNDATIFPIPCPINSLLELCLVFVKESATKEVKRESIDPKTAIVNAIGIMIFTSENFIIGKTKEGKPLGISPITLILKPNITVKAVPKINAINGAGTSFAIFLGIKNTIAKVIKPIITVWISVLFRFFRA